MKISLVVSICAFVILNGCAVKKTIVSERKIEIENFDLNYFCDTVAQRKSIYYSGVEALINYDDKLYESKMSLYYLPDSALFISIVNLGFEIFRSAIFKDSTIVINRLEKSVYILHNDNTLPLTFEDIELLLDNSQICNYKVIINKELNQLQVEKSILNVKKNVNIRVRDFRRSGFEFFNKKTGEYFVGERLNDDQLKFYGNFLIGRFELTATTGKIEFNIDKKIKLNINRSKYDVYYF